MRIKAPTNVDAEIGVEEWFVVITSSWVSANRTVLHFLLIPSKEGHWSVISPEGTPKLTKLFVQFLLTPPRKDQLGWGQTLKEPPTEQN